MSLRSIFYDTEPEKLSSRVKRRVGDFAEKKGYSAYMGYIGIDKYSRLLMISMTGGFDPPFSNRRASLLLRDKEHKMPLWIAKLLPYNSRCRWDIAVTNPYNNIVGVMVNNPKKNMETGVRIAEFLDSKVWALTECVDSILLYKNGKDAWEHVDYKGSGNATSSSDEENEGDIFEWSENKMRNIAMEQIIEELGWDNSRKINVTKQRAGESVENDPYLVLYDFHVTGPEHLINRLRAHR